MVDASEYLGLFLDESREHLQELNASILGLERDPSSEDAISTVFRAAHTLKGMSATMGFEVMSRLTHRMEEVLSQFRDAGRPVTGDVVDVLFACLDTLESMVDDIGAGGDGRRETDELLGRLAAAQAGERRKEALAEAAATVAPEQVTEAASAEPRSSDGAEAPARTAVAPDRLGGYERMVLDGASERGPTAVRLRFGFAEGCMLRAARAAMVARAVEALGELVASEPPLEELQGEEPSDRVTLWMLTGASPDVVAAAAEAVSEIEGVAVDEVDRPAADPRPEGGPAPGGAPARGGPAAHRKTASTVRVGTDKLDELMNLMGEMVVQRSRLGQLVREGDRGEMSAALDDFGRVANDLQALIMQVRMTAVGVVFQRFPRMVRDLGNSLNKRIELVIEGEDTELDRTVIDELGDPLVHLLRNAADHGLESPDERRAAGKSPVGTVRLGARHRGSSVEITVSDDGRGIDPDGIRGAAVAKGLLSRTAADALSDREAIDLVFRPGFTTAAETTHVSGRGVGMDAARSKIRGLNGEVVIDSRRGEGTTFTITLPLTLAIIRALLVRAGEQTYAIPFDAIEETVVIGRDDTRPVNGQDCIVVRDRVVPLVELRERLGPDGPGEPRDRRSVVVIRSSEGDLGVAVDALIGHQDVVIKRPPGHLGEVEAVAGATILGDGSVAHIVDVGALRGPGKGGLA